MRFGGSCKTNEVEKTKLMVRWWFKKSSSTSWWSKKTLKSRNERKQNEATINSKKPNQRRRIAHLRERKQSGWRGNQRRSSWRFISRRRITRRTRGVKSKDLRGNFGIEPLIKHTKRRWLKREEEVEERELSTQEKEQWKSWQGEVKRLKKNWDVTLL